MFDEQADDNMVSGLADKVEPAVIAKHNKAFDAAMLQHMSKCISNR